jgi:hypothetical protein
MKYYAGLPSTNPVLLLLLPPSGMRPSRQLMLLLPSRPP